MDVILGRESLMAIPQGRLSTTAVIGDYQEPEGVNLHPITTYEFGPIDVEDTTEGLLYQTWRLLWDTGTGDFILRGETSLDEYTIGNSPGVLHASFTFDQSGRVTFAWTNAVSSYLQWFDTLVAETVTEDLGPDMITPTIYLDDKRATQNIANDMQLWYTKPDGVGKYTLYKRLQRERFLIEVEMETDLTAYYIIACGMTSKLRVQLRMIKEG